VEKNCKDSPLLSLNGDKDIIISLSPQSICFSEGCRLYVLDQLDAITSLQLENAIEVLPDWRREKTLRFKFEQGRKECAFSYLLLCHALREQYGITEQPAFIIGEHGKPELSFPNTPDNQSSLLRRIRGELPFFNLSHCKNAIACVLSDRSVGVDVERIGRYSESLARHVLNESEYEEVVRSADPQTAFIRFWTKKEAVVKLTGRGIDDDLKNLLSNYPGVSFFVKEYPDKGYVITVAQ